MAISYLVLIFPGLIDSRNCGRTGSQASLSVHRIAKPSSLQGIQLEKSFGFAPSTIVHQSKEASSGKAKI